MLEGKVVGEVMAIKIAEIGAQGEDRTFTIISVDELGNVQHYTPQRSGSFSMTYCGLGTFFKNHLLLMTTIDG